VWSHVLALGWLPVARQWLLAVGSLQASPHHSQRGPDSFLIAVGLRLVEVTRSAASSEGLWWACSMKWTGPQSPQSPQDQSHRKWNEPQATKAHLSVLKLHFAAYPDLWQAEKTQCCPALHHAGMGQRRLAAASGDLQKAVALAQAAWGRAREAHLPLAGCERATSPGSALQGTKAALTTLLLERPQHLWLLDVAEGQRGEATAQC